MGLLLRSQINTLRSIQSRAIYVSVPAKILTMKAREGWKLVLNTLSKIVYMSRCVFTSETQLREHVLRWLNNVAVFCIVAD